MTQPKRSKGRYDADRNSSLRVDGYQAVRGRRAADLFTRRIGFLRQSQKDCRLYAQGFGKPPEDPDGRVPQAAFDAADVGAVEAGAMGQLLLRKAASLPKLP